MTVRDAIHIFQISQKNLHRKRTTDSYRYLLEHLENHFTNIHVEAITPDQIYQFLEALTEHMAKSTRRLRYAQVKAFFNFLINEKGVPIKNPCQDSIMVKAFKSPRMKQKDILSRESVDEIIYRSKKIRDRLILELQARCGMRIGEVLNIRVTDITDRKLWMFCTGIDVSNRPLGNHFYFTRRLHCQDYPMKSCIFIKVGCLCSRKKGTLDRFAQVK
jgi:integrase/recombinase XerD